MHLKLNKEGKLDCYSVFISISSPAQKNQSVADQILQEQAKISFGLNEVNEIKEEETQPKQEANEAHHETAPLQQPEPSHKNEEQKFIHPQEVQYEPEVHSKQNQENQIELAVFKETPAHSQYEQREERKPSAHMEPLQMDQHNAVDDESNDIKSGECVETPDASRRLDYVSRNVIAQE